MPSAVRRAVAKFFVIIALFGGAVVATQASAITTAGADSSVLNVKAWIDGRSDLILHGDTAQWQHFDFNAPGLEGGNFPTVLNGDDWFPKWPVANPRDCHCFSNVFHGVDLPLRFSKVTLKVVACRESCAISTSGNTVTVHFNDNNFGGAAWYIVRLVFQT